MVRFFYSLFLGLILFSWSVETHLDLLESGECSEDIQKLIVSKIKVFRAPGGLEYVLSMENCGEIIDIFPKGDTRKYVKFSYSLPKGKCKISYIYLDRLALSGWSWADFLVYVIKNPNSPAVKCEVSISEPLDDSMKGIKIRLQVN